MSALQHATTKLLALGLTVGLGWILTPTPVLAQETKPRATLTGHKSEVLTVVFSPDGKTLASGGYDNNVRLWTVETGKEQAVWKNVSEFGVESVLFSPDGKTLATGFGGNTIKLWDIATQKDTTLLSKQSQFAGPQIALSTDGKMLASGGRCISEIRLFDTTAGKLSSTLKGHDAYGTKAMAFTPDAKTLITVGHDGKIKLWDVATGKNTNTRKTGDWAPAAAISPDGKTVAVARWVVETINGENTIQEISIRLWDVATGKEATALLGHTKMITSISFSPDGKLLATGSEDHTVRLWDVAKSKELATFNGHTDEVHAVAFSADGKLLASGSSDKTIKLWDVPKPK